FIAVSTRDPAPPSFPTRCSSDLFFRKGATRYSHIIDPRTGYPLEHALVSVTVVHPDCMQADALSTALTVLGPDQGMDYARQHKLDRKSTRLNSSHVKISYAVFCL